MPLRDFKDARCLVTGASMGLGRALAEDLVRRGARVVLAARSVDRLREVSDHLIASGARARLRPAVPRRRDPPGRPGRPLAVRVRPVLRRARPGHQQRRDRCLRPVREPRRVRRPPRLRDQRLRPDGDVSRGPAPAAHEGTTRPCATSARSSPAAACRAAPSIRPASSPSPGSPRPSAPSGRATGSTSSC